MRGLTLTGLGGDTGINVTSVGNLHVEGCVISGFISNGIFVNLTADGSHIFIKDTITRNNGDAGIYITTSTGTVRASIDNCRSERNAIGFDASINSRVTINRSVASGNSGGGFIAVSNTSGATAELSCEECVASNTGSGFIVSNSVSGGVAFPRPPLSGKKKKPPLFIKKIFQLFKKAGKKKKKGKQARKKKKKKKKKKQKEKKKTTPHTQKILSPPP